MDPVSPPPQSKNVFFLIGWKLIMIRAGKWAFKKHISLRYVVCKIQSGLSSMTLRVVSINGFFSILCSLLYSEIYYFKFSCFPFYSGDVIVSQKSPNENESNLSEGGAYFIDGPS